MILKILETCALLLCLQGWFFASAVSWTSCWCNWGAFYWPITEPVLGVLPELEQSQWSDCSWRETPQCSVAERSTLAKRCSRNICGQLPGRNRLITCCCSQAAWLAGVGCLLDGPGQGSRQTVLLSSAGGLSWSELSGIQNTEGFTPSVPLPLQTVPSSR